MERVSVQIFKCVSIRTPFDCALKFHHFSRFESSVNRVVHIKFVSRAHLILPSKYVALAVQSTFRTSKSVKMQQQMAGMSPGITEQHEVLLRLQIFLSNLAFSMMIYDA